MRLNEDKTNLFVLLSVSIISEAKKRLCRRLEFAKNYADCLKLSNSLRSNRLNFLTTISIIFLTQILKCDRGISPLIQKNQYLRKSDPERVTDK